MKQASAKLPVELFDNPIGANAIIAISVPPNIAHIELFTVFEAESSTDFPLSNSTKIPSAITIGLSTNEPNAMMSAPNETICKKCQLYS